MFLSKFFLRFNIISVSKYSNLSATYRELQIFLSIVLKSTAPQVNPANVENMVS
jgi:hypothetical protein